MNPKQQIDERSEEASKPKDAGKPPYTMRFDVGTIKHLGLQMYSTLPPVIAELVANAWDANASRVEINIPTDPLSSDESEITIFDDGSGMSDEDIRSKYVVTGRDRREEEGNDTTPEPLNRKVMGRKGIGKFSSFGIAKEIEIESVKNEEISRFIMNYDDMLAIATDQSIRFDALAPTGKVTQGTKITLRNFTKFQRRRIPIVTLRRGIARRFSIIGGQNDFEVVINGDPISPEERDLLSLLENDADGNRYIWNYSEVEVKDGEDWTVSGWVGALKRTSQDLDGIDRGIALMARGKLVQEPFVFEAVVGQQYALSYIIGELHVEFVDAEEDTIGTNRNALVWDEEANDALKQWGKAEVNRIAREWARKRRSDNQRALQSNEHYIRFQTEANNINQGRALKLADQLVKQTIDANPVGEIVELQSVIRTALDFLQFDAFWDLIEDVTEAELADTAKLLNLFREWQIVEAKEMMRVTEGRIETIKKFQGLVEDDAMEVPTLHNFLKEFPWIIDAKWVLVDDEVYYTQLLREKFPESDEIPEENRRIDFLCVRGPHDLVVVEIKRPGHRASRHDLNQIEDYVNFVRTEVVKTTDPAYAQTKVMGYLICGNTVDVAVIQERVRNLAAADIYVRRYRDLLSSVEGMHREFLDRYEKLQAAKSEALDRSVDGVSSSGEPFHAVLITENATSGTP